MTKPKILQQMTRLADALERLAPVQRKAPDFSQDESRKAWVWNAKRNHFHLVAQFRARALDELMAIPTQKEALLKNSLRFAQGHTAHNALLWGARGMGKSALIKAVVAHINDQARDNSKLTPLTLIEVHRSDIDCLEYLLRQIAPLPRLFVLFCDDLSFEIGEAAYKGLKSVLEGGLEGRPGNCLFYASSNRRHLLELETADTDVMHKTNPRDWMDERVALSDRFGLWLGFHECSQEDYLTIVHNYARVFALSCAEEKLTKQALLWARGRGHRSGRVAWQFIEDLAGQQGRILDEQVPVTRTP